MKGIDSAVPLRAVAAQLAAQGIGWAGRYYSYNAAKNLSPREAQALAAAGVAIVTVWEAQGDQIRSFTTAQGQRDGAEAARLAKLCSQPGASAIYFAVDFDASPTQLPAIAAYFSAVVGALRGEYAVGVYGSGLVCQALKDRGLARYFWLAGSTGWRGCNDFAAPHIRQQILPEGDGLGLGFAVDLDESVDRDFGDWQAPAPPAAADPGTGVVAAIKALQTQLQAGGFYEGDVDGEWGPESEAAMAAFRAAA